VQTRLRAAASASMPYNTATTNVLSCRAATAAHSGLCRICTTTAVTT
jgi:hypothetical protein